MYVSLNLDKLRDQSANFSSKHPFQHQIEAFEALNRTFKLGKEKSGSGILVLPTGAGKTFTAVRWLSDHIIPKNIKILWLAPSFYLLDQAFSTFLENAKEIQDSKKFLNIRSVSGNPSHAKASSIKSTDDVIIMTTPTAINNLHTDAVDKFGVPVQTAFRKFIENCKDTDFFVVVDEAHHSPAYGCRNLLVSDNAARPGLRKLLPRLNLLGLTATPTHGNNAIRGWLWKVFDDKIIYEADKANLISQKILARPNYIKVHTGKEIEVDDELYKRLVNQHKDLPESIIKILATDKDRNNLIVNSYVKKQKEYGKTIIFADRWFQCVYIKEKLLEMGIKADAIYSHVDADPGSAEARNKRTKDDNKRILEQFKTGKDEHGNDALDVLINVRMLTEGADVPSVQTVFITRQTTSSILITQMIGRALRGEKAGGSSEANIILFIDNWKQIIDWAKLPDGDEDDKSPLVKGHDPHEYISIRLVEEVAKSITCPEDYTLPDFSMVIPVGWYKTEIVYANLDNQQDSMEAFIDFVMVYEHTKQKFDAFINFITSASLSDEWTKEFLDESWMQPQVDQWIDEWFEIEADNMGNRLALDLIKITRHIAQNQSRPPYHSFEERERYDLDKLAQRTVALPLGVLRGQLSQEFLDTKALWRTFYKSFSRFETAVHAAIRKILDRGMYGSNGSGISTISEPKTPSELTEVEKKRIKQRDGYVCLCCGAQKGGSLRLQIDHIVPRKFGGETSLENSQTLCSLCNRRKGINALDFRFNVSPLERSKSLDSSSFKPLLLEDRDVVRTITRIVNFFYHCRAVHKINCHKRRNGGHYLIWEIHLHAGNNPEWLLNYKAELLDFVQNQLRHLHVQDIKVLAPDQSPIASHHKLN